MNKYEVSNINGLLMKIILTADEQTAIVCIMITSNLMSI